MGARRIPLAAAAALVASCLAVGVPVTAASAADPMCGSMAGTPSHITKVLWIAMENQSYGNGSSQIPGSASDPYIKNTLTAQCGSASNFHAATHPSYPNYLALTSGSTQNHFSDSLTYVPGPSIFSQVDPSWRSYDEFMPTPCDHVFQTGTNPPSQYYLGRHNPAASYSDLPVGAPTAGDCTSNDVPMGTTTTGALHDDAANGTLPKFSLLTPGLCDDMHQVPTGDTSCPDPVKGGDDWLATWIPILTSSPDYVNGNLLIDVVWDEGHGGSAGDDCINLSLSSCIVPNLVLSPYTTPGVSNANTSQYSLLKTTEEILGVPLLGHAADPSTSDLCAPYGICPLVDQPPAASFSSSCQLLSCSFDGSASTGSGSAITDYAWTFGDDSTGTGAAPSHDYAAAGTYAVSLTITTAVGETATVTKQVTVSDGSAQPIGFDGSAGAAGSTQSTTVVVPRSVQPGDAMVLTAAAATTATPTVPAGWTLVGSQPVSPMGTSVWTKIATAVDPGSAVSVVYPTAVKSAVTVAAYSGVDSTSPVAAFAASGAHVTTTSAATPQVVVPATGDWVVSSWSAKSSSVNSWTAPSGAQTRSTVIGTGGGRISSLLTDPGAPAPAGTAGGLVASTDQAFGTSVTTSLVLAVGCGDACTAPPPPAAAFTASCIALSCTFDGSGSTAPGSAIASYDWSFGDAAMGSGVAPSHTYPAGGTYPVTLTVTTTDGAVASVTQAESVAGAAAPITFVAAAGATKNSTKDSVTVPAAVTAGDGLVLIATGVTTGTLVAPAGWTLERTQPNTTITTAIWSKVATPSDAGSTVTVTLPAQVKSSVQVAAYSGTSSADPVAAVTGAASHLTASSATTPVVPVPGAGYWLASYWSAKSSAISSWTTSVATARNSAIGSGGGQISSLLADSNAALNASTVGGLAATANQPFSAADTLSILLVPSS